MAQKVENLNKPTIYLRKKLHEQKRDFKTLKTNKYLQVCGCLHK